MDDIVHLSETSVTSHPLVITKSTSVKDSQTPGSSTRDGRTYTLEKVDPTKKSLVSIESDDRESPPTLTIEKVGGDESLSIEEKKEKNTSDEPGQRDWKKVGYLTALVGLAVVLAGVAIMGLAIIFPPAAPILACSGLTLIAVGMAVADIGVYLLTKGDTKKDKEAQDFMTRFSSGAKSYDEVLSGYKTIADTTLPLMTFEDLKTKTGKEPSDLLKELNESYEVLKKLTDPPKKNLLSIPPGKWEIDLTDRNNMKKFAEYNKKIDNDFKLTVEQKTKLKNEELNTKQIKSYETYWKNFFILQAAQAASDGPKANMFYK